MYTIDKIENRVDEIFEVHEKEMKLACNEAHEHTVLQDCFRADDLNELIICELCEWVGILLGRLNTIREKTE